MSIKDVTVEVLQQSLESALKSADRWKSEGNDQMESACLSSAVRERVRIALLTCDDAEHGISDLQQSDSGKHLNRYCELDRRLNDAATMKMGSSATGRTMVHICWLLDEPALALEQIDELRHPGNIAVNGKDRIAKFWDVYDRSLEALARNCVFEAEFEQLKGAHLHWAPYPRLISAITNQRDITQPVEEIRQSFEKRHRDKRVYLDILDGHPDHPVRWDFRAASILRCAEQMNKSLTTSRDHN